MDKLRTKTGFIQRAIAKTISMNDALQADEAFPALVLHKHLKLILSKQTELIKFDHTIQDTLTDGDLEAELITAFKYEQEVGFIKTSVHHRAASTNPSRLHRLHRKSYSTTCLDTATSCPIASPRASPMVAASHVALPKLHVPSFSGKWHEWQGF